MFAVSCSRDCIAHSVNNPNCRLVCVVPLTTPTLSPSVLFPDTFTEDDYWLNTFVTAMDFVNNTFIETDCFISPSTTLQSGDSRYIIFLTY